jgi:ADP-ribose pyrophosphatase YjhB (NUDIX family)
MEIRSCVALVHLEPSGLLCVRRALDPEAGSWCLPAGHVEANETKADAVVREVREETGMQCGVVFLLGEYMYVNRAYRRKIHIFGTEKLQGSLRAGDDATEAAFILPQNLNQVPHFNELIRIALKLLKEFQGSSCQ